MTMFSLYDFTSHTKTSLRIFNPTVNWAIIFVWAETSKSRQSYVVVFVEECRCTTNATLAIFYYYFCTLIMIIIMVVTLPCVYLSFSKKILLWRKNDRTSKPQHYTNWSKHTWNYLCLAKKFMLHNLFLLFIYFVSLSPFHLLTSLI